MQYETYLERISERAIGRYDVTALFDEYRVLEAVIADYAKPFRGSTIDAVAGIDALGFVLGTGVALELNAGFVPIRKGGKLPIPEDDRLAHEVADYSGTQKILEINATRVSSGCHVLIVDDWIETAAQMEAAITLVEQAGGTVVGISVLDSEENERSHTIAREYDLHTVNPERNL